MYKYRYLFKNRSFISTSITQQLQQKQQQQRQVFPIIITNINRLSSSRKTLKPKNYPKKSDIRPVKIQRAMTVKQLADAMQRSNEHVIDCLKTINPKICELVTRNDEFIIRDYDLIQNIVKINGYRVQLAFDKENSDDLKEIEYLEKNDVYIDKRPKIDVKKLVKRSPIVTIMGHVDHGKTSLLDALRNTNVVENEFGGITQHIGAFNSKLISEDGKEERNITFLDTPGHAAFMSMRARGASITDIIVLVVAGDDGIMAQTVESIELAKQSNCAFIVAINKIDKCTVDQIERVKRDLIKYGIQVEDMGGDVQCVPISALKKQNIELLKEEIWTLAEVLELKGDPTPGLTEGYVIESFNDVNRGKLASVIIKRGTLRKGAFIVSGTTYAKVKQIFDDQHKTLNEARLSSAIQVLGWRDLPVVGNDVLEVESEKRAKEICDIRTRKIEIERLKNEFTEIKKYRDEYNEKYKKRLNELRLRGAVYGSRARGDMSHGERFSEDVTFDNEKNRCLPIVLKTDVNGSLEAILNVLETYDSHDKVKLDIISFGVGSITKSDLELATTFNAQIYCFNIDTKLNDGSDNNVLNKYRIKHFNIIYRLFEDVKIELEKLAPLVEQEDVNGEAEVSQVFDIDMDKNKIQIAGGRCINGSLDSRKLFKLIRINGDIVALKVKCKSLKHYKTEVQTIKKGTEFGISFEDTNIKFERGDRILCYDVKMVRDKIEWELGF